MSHSSTMIAPGQWLGIVGGGQLGRMFCHAAQALGYKVAVLDPAESCPAGVAADLHIRAGYDDAEGLARLAERCLAITTEFENVPAASLQWLSERRRVCPQAGAVATAQDRHAEKSFIAAQGIDVAPYVYVEHASDIDQADGALFPGILKAARLGYDGKGQARVADRQAAREAFDAFGGVPCVLEAMLDLDYEISVVLARGTDGGARTFPIARNVHEDGILARTTVGQDDDSEQARVARQAALAIADGLDYHGVLCVEFFVLKDGRLVVNEMAPRPHNSGHFSIDACMTSQFEQQVRVLAGLPLGSTRLMAPAVMLNILGDVWFDGETDTVREPAWSRVLQVEGAKLHLYGKADARRARKMGHVTCVGATADQAISDALAVARALGLQRD